MSLRLHDFAVIVVLGILLTPVCYSRSDPLEVLCSGHIGAMPYLGAILRREPMTDAIVIPTRIGGTTLLSPMTIRRYMRLYFPRGYDDLVAKYEFLLLEQIDSEFFTDYQFEWMRRGVEEAGLGGLQDRSVMSMHDRLSVPWSQSPLARAFPNDAEQVVLVDYDRNGPLEVVMNRNPTLPPVVRAYENVLEFNVGWWGSNLMIPRLGSEIYTWSKTGVFPEFAYPDPGLFPHILGWRYGKGYTWSVQDILGASFWTESTNPYATDVMIAMLLYSTGRKIPEDVMLVHNLRTSFGGYAEIKEFIFSLMDFIDQFGANTAALLEDVEKLNQRWNEARTAYLSQDYAESWSMIESLLTDIYDLRSDALTLKDRALFWIYIIEWLSVSGTFLMAGFVLWTLMVRRRLYKQVEITKLKQR